MMKSFWCSPPILCVHHVTVTLPHSVNSAGWCPSSSARSPTSSVKASASAKLRNPYVRSRRFTPPRSTTCHSGTCRRSSAISSSVSVGSPPLQAVHFICVSSLILLFSLSSSNPEGGETQPPYRSLLARCLGHPHRLALYA